MTEKEKLFCEFYADTLNPTVAAAKAGFDSPERTGRLLLSKGTVKRKVDGLFSRQNRIKAIKGLEKIAFGNVSDAVKVIFAESIGEEDLKSADLYSVSEIKRGANGTVEIKFFDRLKALSMLTQIEETEKSDKSGFFDAIEKGAEILREEI